MDKVGMRKKTSHFKRFSLYLRGVQFSIIFSFFVLVSAVAGSIIIHTYIQYTEKMTNLADNQVHAIAQDTLQNIAGFLEPIEEITRISKWFIQTPNRLTQGQQTISIQIIGILETLPRISSFTIGLEDGNILTVNHVIKGSSYAFKKHQRLPENAEFRVHIINNQKEILYETYEYYDELGQKLTFENRSLSLDLADESLYDPRKRPWYKEAKKAHQTTWVDIYPSVYEKDESLLTVSNPILEPSGKFLGVVAAGIFIKEFSKFLKSQIRGVVSSAFLFDGSGKVIAYSEDNGKEGNITHVKNISHLNIHEAYAAYIKNPEKRIVYAADSDDLDDVAYFFPFSDLVGKNWTLGIIINGKTFLGIVQEIRTNTIYFSIALVALTIFLMIFISWRIAAPIQVVANSLEDLQHLKLDPIPPIKSRLSDIQKMIEGLNGLASGLRSFGKFIPKSLSLQFLEQKEEVRVGGENKEVTVLFTDIQDFTSISEKIPTSQLAFYLSDYFEEMTHIIQTNQGTVDKYIGDAIMAFWGTPVENDRHAYWACRAALLCQRQLEELNKKWEEEKKPRLITRFGISTGVAFAGNTGSSDRLQYTLLGDCVNLGARLESANKVYGTGILISEKTYKTIHDKFIVRPVDLIAVKGQEKGGQIYELLCEISEENNQERMLTISERAMRTQQAYQFYLKRHWAEALEEYKALQGKFPEDGLAQVFIKRCENFIETPPYPSWDGVFRMNMHV